MERSKLLVLLQECQAEVTRENRHLASMGSERLIKEHRVSTERAGQLAKAPVLIRTVSGRIQCCCVVKGKGLINLIQKSCGSAFLTLFLLFPLRPSSEKRVLSPSVRSGCS